MPKGGMLHCHMDATVDIHTLVKMALKQPNIHISISDLFPPSLTAIESSPLSALPLPQFTTLKTGAEVNHHSLFADDYKPGTWAPLASARANFPENLGGVKGFDKWIYKAMTIDPDEAYRTHASVTKVGH